MFCYVDAALKCLSRMYTKCRGDILILTLLRINRFETQIMKLYSGIETLLSFGLS
jgi:hypothetical protein